MTFTNTNRWQELAVGGVKPSWWKRNEKVAAYIPDNCSVLDIGSGDKHIRQLIPSTCLYTPLDCVDDGSGETIIIDFNKDDESNTVIGSYDYAICSGVLEYIINPKTLISFIVGNSKNCVLTYVTTEARKQYNSSNGWISELTLNDLRMLITDAGGTIIHEDKWQNHTVICFTV